MIRICTVAARTHLVASQPPYSFVPVQAEQKDSLFPESLIWKRHNECGFQASIPKKGKVKSTLENQGNHNSGLFFLLITCLFSPSAYHIKEETVFCKTQNLPEVRSKSGKNKGLDI